MATEEPLCLSVGTEVSAKYRGAFCEAKVKKVSKIVKCKVIIKDTNLPLVVLDEDLKGTLKVGATIEVKLPESGEYTMAIVQKINDMSMYTVVFDDGDENTLRRTQLCLKGEKHFVKSDTLDELPLTNPEHFGTPVIKTMNVSKRKHSVVGSDRDSDDDSSEDSLPCKRMYRGRLQDLIGRVLCIELEDRKGTTWVPVLVVQSSADDAELKSKDHLLVKSFRDSKFYTVTKKLSREFTREMALKNEDKAIKPAFEKALLYYDTRLLPQGWDREELLGSDTEEGEDVDESSDNEPNEEKDHFVAQLYKFMDDRGTPINKAPVIASKDLNLYRLFRVVQNLGGYNRVTNQMKWRIVYSRMNLTPSSAASNQIKVAYKKYLHAFEDFYRKLGSTMGTISRPGGRGRHSSSGRSLMSIRDRESAPRSPRVSKKASLEDVREKKVGSPLQTDASTEKEAIKSESRTKAKPAAAASEPHIKDATSGATARESRSEGRPETRASLEDRDSPRAKGETRGREGVRKTESLSANLNDSPRRRVSRLMAEHRKVAAREAKEREVKREQPDDSADEGRKELRGESLRRRKEEEGKEPKEEVRRGRPQSDGKREDTGKKEETKEEARVEARLGSPTSQRGKQEEGGKREDSRRGKQQEETSKAGGKEDEKGAAEKRTQKDDQEKEEVSDSEEKEGGKQKKRVTRKKLKEEVGLEEREEGRTERKTNETKTEKPKDVRSDKPKEVKADKPKEVKADKPKEVKADKPKEVKSEKIKDVKTEKVKEVKGEKPKEMKAEKGKEVKLDKPKEVKSEKVKEVKLERTDKQMEERSENSDDSADSKDVRDDRRQEGEYPIGTKLKVKYGRGRNQKLYEAKVVEKERDTNVLHYRVHYDGWNKRYDEWIRKERIVGVVEELVEPPKKIKPKTPVTKTKVLVKKVAKSPGAVPSPVTPSVGAPSRPTRSNSIEASLSSGLPMKAMKPRSTSGQTESSDQQTHTSESEGEEEEEEEEEDESTLKTGEDNGSEVSETNEDTEVAAQVASPAHLPQDSPEKGVGSGKEDKDDEEEEEEETVVVEPRTLRRREDVKLTSTPKSGSDLLPSRAAKIDTAVTMPKLSLVSPQKDAGDVSEVKMETEDTMADDEAAGEATGVKETESFVGKDDVSQPEAAPAECPKIEKVDKMTSDDEKVDKKQVKPRTRRREGARSKPATKMTGESSAKVEESAVKSDDIGSDKDVVTATEPEEQPSVEMEEDAGDEEEKREKGRKRTKVTKEKPLEKTPKSKGKIEKGDRQKGRPSKLKKLEGTPTPSEDVEVKVKKRVKRVLAEKTAHDEEANSDLSEKEALAEPLEAEINSDKTETKQATACDSVVDRIVPSNDIVTTVGDTPTEASNTAQCASPDHQGSPTPEAPKLWESVSVDVSASCEPPAEKAPDLSPVAGAGLQPQKHVTDSPAKPDTAPTDAAMSPALKAEASTAIFDNTPPSTPEHTSSVTAITERVEESSSRVSLCRPDEVYSTKSEFETNFEVAALMAKVASSRSKEPDVPTQVCESPIPCDMSTMSNSSGGSSGNAPGSESEEPPSGSLQKDDDDSGEPTPKRRKRTHKRPIAATPGGAGTEKAKHRLNVAPTAKPELSDSDDGADTRAEEASSQGSVEKPTTAVSVASPDRHSARPSKYNFIESLEEGKYLEGEKRIDFLVGKIQEIRKIYMQLKAEVACIDRRRKRHRRRERESNKTSGDQQQTPSHMDIECS